MLVIVLLVHHWCLKDVNSFKQIIGDLCLLLTKSVNICHLGVIPTLNVIFFVFSWVGCFSYIFGVIRHRWHCVCHSWLLFVLDGHGLYLGSLWQLLKIKFQTWSLVIESWCCLTLEIVTKSLVLDCCEAWFNKLAIIKHSCRKELSTWFFQGRLLALICYFGFLWILLV